MGRHVLAGAMRLGDGAELPLLRDSLETPEDTEPIADGQRFRLRADAFPETAPSLPKLFEHSFPGRAPLELAVLAKDNFRDVRQAAAKKLGVGSDSVQLLYRDGIEVCSDDESIG